MLPGLWQCKMAAMFSVMQKQSINLTRSTKIGAHLKNEQYQAHTLQRFLNYFEECKFLFGRIEFQQLFLQKALIDKTLQQKPAKIITSSNF